MEIEPCLPWRRSRKQVIPQDKTRYDLRHKIDTMAGRLKDWQRIATRYDRCPEVLLWAIARAATVLFWF